MEPMDGGGESGGNLRLWGWCWWPKGLGVASDVTSVGRGSRVERGGETRGDEGINEVCGMTGQVQVRFNIA